MFPAVTGVTRYRVGYLYQSPFYGGFYLYVFKKGLSFPVSFR